MSPRNEWEVYIQLVSGGCLVARVGAATDFEAVQTILRSIINQQAFPHRTYPIRSGQDLRHGVVFEHAVQEIYIRR